MYASKAEVARGIFCLKLVQVPFATKIAEPMIKLCSKTRITDQALQFFLKKTMFGHFCAGETLEEVGKTINKLESKGICGILDYAAEAPITGGGEVDFGSATERTKQAVRHVASSSEYPEMATKMTGFLPPEDLYHASELIKLGREAFRLFSHGISDLGHLFSHILNYQELDQALITYGSYVLSCRALGWTPMHAEDFEAIIAYAKTLAPMVPTSASAHGLEWHEFEDLLMDFLIAEKPEQHPLCPLIHPFYEWRNREADPLPTLASISVKDGHMRFSEVLDVLRNVADTATNPPFVMMDAESSEIQPAIDLMTLYQTLRVNTKSKGILLGNTYQHYLKDTYSRLLHEHMVHQKYMVPFGAKMVRGAYMTHEKRYSDRTGRPNPVNDTIEATHASYNKSIHYAMDLCASGDMRVTFGTHNEESVQLILDEVDRLAAKGQLIPKGNVTVGQLLGMSDALTTQIASKQDKGILAGKYVPYGPINLVIPYLVRRVEENKDAIARVKTDERYLKSLLASQSLAPSSSRDTPTRKTVAL